MSKCRIKNFAETDLTKLDQDVDAWLDRNQATVIGDPQPARITVLRDEFTQLPVTHFTLCLMYALPGDLDERTERSEAPVSLGEVPAAVQSALDNFAFTGFPGGPVGGFSSAMGQPSVRAPDPYGSKPGVQQRTVVVPPAPGASRGATVSRRVPKPA